MNGPSAAVQARAVAVAWFSLVDEEGRVRATLSKDGGRTFGTPVGLDGGQPLGRVDVEWLGDDTLLVSWLERIQNGQAEIRIQAVGGDEAIGSQVVVARTSASRTSGFPRLAPTKEGVLIAALTLRRSEYDWPRLAAETATTDLGRRRKRGRAREAFDVAAD